MTDLKGLRVLVVGGSSGIGLATAQAAAAAGASVTIASRSIKKIENAVDEIGHGATGATLDLLDGDAVERFFKNSGEWDHIAVTASQVRISGVRDLSMSEARAAMDSKFWGAYRVARSAKIKQGGSLSFVSGYLSKRPAPNRALMSAINAALEGLTQGLAIELRPIRVNAVSPAFVDTPLWDGMTPADRSALVAKNTALYPAGRVGSPNDIAQLLLFFMTNPYATGTVVTLDGGASLV
jgi:NAD(P)-dependent dehydrogenase (short-subunit alcohol dehydrogenase family)